MARIRSAANAEIICTNIADGLTLRQIGKEIGCTASAITHWVAEDAAFAQRYAHAMLARADKFADELVEIADDGTNDWMKREGFVVADHDHINRSRLRVDTRKWLMAKMAPKKYGDKVAITGADDGPLAVRWVGPDDPEPTS